MLDLGLVIVRAAFGLSLAVHGAQKLFGWFGGSGVSGTAGFLGSLGLKPARFWAVAAGVAEVGGGLLIATGLLGPVGPALALAVMAAAIWLVHRARGFWVTDGGIEYPGLVGSAAVGLALTGFGRYALDNVLDLKLHEPAITGVALAAGLLGALVSIAATRVAARPIQAPAGA